MPHVIAVASQKGGVGKTSLTQNLGAELARSGHRVLVVDFDPQSNLTSGWGLDPAADRPTVYTAMLHPELAPACVIHHRPNLDLLPANLDLAGAELQFMGAVDRNIKLQEALAPLVATYEYVLIDGPPSLGFFTVNALVADDEVRIAEAPMDGVSVGEYEPDSRGAEAYRNL